MILCLTDPYNSHSRVRGSIWNTNNSQAGDNCIGVNVGDSEEEDRLGDDDKNSIFDWLIDVALWC